MAVNLAAYTNKVCIQCHTYDLTINASWTILASDNIETESQREVHDIIMIQINGTGCKNEKIVS